MGIFWGGGELLRFGEVGRLRGAGVFDEGLLLNFTVL